MRRWTPGAVVALLVAATALSLPSTARGASPGQPFADRGAALYRTGDLQGARKAFREAVRLDPRHENAWQSLGWVEHRLGHDDEALRIWDDLLRLHPGRAETREAIATLERERDRRARAPARPRASRPERARGAAPPPPAATADRSAAAETPQTPAGPPAPGDLFQRAQGAFAAGDPAGADRVLADLLATPGLDSKWAARAAELYLRHGEVGRGIALLDRPAIPDSPGKRSGVTRLYAARATTAFAAARFDEATEAFARAVALDGENRLALRGLGWAHRRAGRLDDAEAAWRRYAEAFPSLAEPRDLLAGLYLDRHDYAAALEEARASLAIDSAPKGAHLRHIRSLFGLVRIRDARRAAQALAKRLPDDPQAQRVLADALTKSRDFRAAARQWRRVLELDPDSAAAKQNWVRTLYEGGDADAAVEAARKMAEAPDAPASVIELLAEDGRARQDLPEAARWYAELTRRFPEALQYWRTLTQVLDVMGRFQEQVAVARAAVQRLPHRTELELDLANALGNAGRLREAIERTRRHLDTFPDNRAAYEGLVDLLARAGDASAALAMLSRNLPSFYKDYERTMVEASLRARRNELTSATRLLRSVVKAAPGQRFVPIVLYHGVVPNPRTSQISAAAFEAQIAALVSRGYQSITLSELARMTAGEEPFPPRPILITFDDARTDSFRVGDPILAKYGFKATMFVPTARIGIDDAFHAGWETIRRYASSGRWDIQAHGHEAHTPIAIDAAGGRGEYLAYRAWLPAEGRAETTAEFLARLDGDYRACKEEIERHVPGRPVLGYAYPLNQVAYAQTEDRDALRSVNERLAARYYRFGFVQDETGYNRLRPGEAAPFMLRRFEVPAEWSGQELLAHLARNEPVRAARLELARLALDDGRPHAARRMIDEIVREEPLVAPQAEATLAYIAWQEDRPREAATHLAASPPPSPVALPRADTLANRVAWRNDPRGGAESAVFSDSDGRTVLSADTIFRRPLADQLDVALDVGQLVLAERSLPTLHGPQLTGGLSGALGHDLALSSWARFRQLTNQPWVLNGGVSLQLRNEQHLFTFQWLYEDVDTILAALKGIRRHFLLVGYSLQSPLWRIDASGGQFLFDDGNARSDLHATLLRRFGTEGRWGIGLGVDSENSRFVPREYYSPQQLTNVMGRVQYSRNWRDSSSIALNAGLGMARDRPHGERVSGLVGVAFSRWWGSHHNFSTALGVETKAVPGYQSVNATLRLEARF